VIVGVVGSEAAKFTPVTERAARGLIRQLILPADFVVSGECPLGGIDIWSREEAVALGVPFRGFPPKNLRWSDGYKPRNMKIGEVSDVVYCITLAELPVAFEGMRFDFCYHCGTKDHVKSGGCWTVKYAKRLGKEGAVHVIEPNGEWR
jgi:hypothetical protein